MPNWIHILLPLFLWLVNGLMDSWFLPPVWGQTPESTITELSQPEKVRPDRQPGLTIRPMSGGPSFPAPAVSTKVTTTVSGLIVRTTVSQTFRNPSTEWAEGIYVFPLPDQAAVDHLRMRIGERVIEGNDEVECQGNHSGQGSAH